MSDKDQVVINSEFAGPFKDTLKVADIASGQAVDVPVQYYSASEAVPVLSRTRPTAYLALITGRPSDSPAVSFDKTSYASAVSFCLKASVTLFNP